MSSRTTCPGLLPPTADWVLPHQPLIQKCLQTFIQANLLEAFSQLNIPSQICLGVCKVGKSQLANPLRLDILTLGLGGTALLTAGFIQLHGCLPHKGWAMIASAPTRIPIQPFPTHTTSELPSPLHEFEITSPKMSSPTFAP